MPIIRYQPSRPSLPNFNLLDLREEMDRLFGTASPATREIPLNLYQNKDAFVVRAQLPGFTKENLGIEIVDGTLTITAKTETENVKRSLSRVLNLPEQISADRIQASYENGVLSVTLPKREEVKPRQIAVEVK